MAYTVEQEARKAAAVLALNNAKASYDIRVNDYNVEMNKPEMACYDGTKETATAASTWFNPTTGSCRGTGPVLGVAGWNGCTSNDKAFCQGRVNNINNTTIPNLRAAYSKWQQEIDNLQTVLNQIAAEAASDPETLADVAGAEAAGLGAAMTNRTKWIIFGVIVVALIAGYLIYRRYIK